MARGQTWVGSVGFYLRLGTVDGIRAGRNEPGGVLVSFYPVSGSDVARGRTWVGSVGFYPGLGTVDGVHMGGNEGGGIGRRSRVFGR